ncbi:unnamed protein product [Thlaspi arvense]|uniref:FBD domain-containing protein n=1 Tax=Thlaspi arvense TaxID=13288 RepID=A0AAU9STB2_THLAR|nr:unnamed protein product [Thlaspi arvense]
MVSRCVRELELRIEYYTVLPSSLYTCKSLVTLRLEGYKVRVNVPGTVCLPSLKTLELQWVIYSNEDSLGLLLSCCPVLEDLVIKRGQRDNVKALVVTVPSLQRLSLWIASKCSSDGYVIDTPSLKYLIVKEHRDSSSYSIKHMPKLENAHAKVGRGIDLQKFLGSITSVKLLNTHKTLNQDFFIGYDFSMYRAGTVFDQLEYLKLNAFKNDWSKLLVRLLNASPNLRALTLSVYGYFDDQEQIRWSFEPSSIPKCLLKSLKTFKFKRFKGRSEERDFLSFLFKHTRCLKSSSILSSR